MCLIWITQGCWEVNFCVELSVHQQLFECFNYSGKISNNGHLMTWLHQNKFVYPVVSRTKVGSWNVPWRRCEMMWLLLFSLIIHCKVVQLFPVFTFNGTSPSSTPTPSYAYLVNDVDLPDKFILCTSVKQARFDDVGFYVISGKDSKEWLSTIPQSLSH